MFSTTLITPTAKYEYLVNGDQARITMWVLKGSKAKGARGYSQSTQCSAVKAGQHYEALQEIALA